MTRALEGPRLNPEQQTLWGQANLSSGKRIEGAMGQCRCSSKKHGHGERCNRPTADNSDFCEECKQQMAIDRITGSKPNLTPMREGSEHTQTAVRGEAGLGNKESHEHRGSRRDPEERPINAADKDQVREKMLDKTLADSFPTSDPPSSIPDPGEEDPLV